MTIDPASREGARGYRMRWPWQPPCVLRGIIANLTDDPSTAIQGVLWGTRGPWFIVREASLLKAGAPPARIDGEIVIHRDRIAFFQVP